MHYLSICAIVKNEARYLDEWINYHILRGVEHFYIFDNGSEDSTPFILERYAKAGIVTAIRFLGDAVQCVAYQRALDMFKNQTEWMAFIDTDEFLDCKECPDTKTYLSLFDKNVAGVASHWVLFGSNGKEEYEPELVIKRFTRRERNCDKHVKSIVRPRLIDSVGQNPHAFNSVLGAWVVDEGGLRVSDKADYALNASGNGSIFRIAHYHTKSKGEYFVRKSKDPDANIVRHYTKERIEEMFVAHDKNEVEDKSLAEFADAVNVMIVERRGY